MSYCLYERTYGVARRLNTHRVCVGSVAKREPVIEELTELSLCKVPRDGNNYGRHIIAKIDLFLFLERRLTERELHVLTCIG